jgi:hypothetical protein
MKPQNNLRQQAGRDYAPYRNARSSCTLVIIFQIFKSHLRNIYLQFFGGFKSLLKQMQGATTKVGDLVRVIRLVFNFDEQVIQVYGYGSHKAILPLITKFYIATPSDLLGFCNYWGILRPTAHKGRKGRQNG